MRRIIGIAALGTALAIGMAQADDQNEGKSRRFRTGLDGYQEVPPVSTAATGVLLLRASRDGSTLEYTLSYSSLQGDITQSHIHFGRPAINGGIMVWLCGTAGLPGPAGTPLCPDPKTGTISGTLDAADVIGPSGQGIAPAEFAEVISSLRRHAAYGNVHSTLFPGGEIRGNVR